MGYSIDMQEFNRLNNEDAAGLKNALYVAASISPLALLLKSNPAKHPGHRLDLVMVRKFNEPW